MKLLAARLLRPRGKDRFIALRPPGANLLDVGCGNSSPARAKAVNPELHYIGLDVGDYNQAADSISKADDYVVVTPDKFAATIESLAGTCDAVLSSHNLEHCDEPERVVRAMCRALKPGGWLYLAFPNPASVAFPRRGKGALNYYDDPTHAAPISPDEVREALVRNDLEIEYFSRAYKPAILWFVGMLLEPLSAATRRVMPFGSTWAFWGFETVIWALRAPARSASPAA